MSFAGLSPSEMLAQRTNATNATSTADGGSSGAQNTVVMPLGSSSAIGGQGYKPDQITVSPGASVIWDITKTMPFIQRLLEILIPQPPMVNLIQE
ncbi:MAG: hypothetical protein M3297_00800 [Thermoproteota archaeon]|jgi:hypothetical protein|nr:hypothetical protein [Thermoproteota archaeon]